MRFTRTIQAISREWINLNESMHCEVTKRHRSGDFTSEISVWFPRSEGTQDSPGVPVVYVGTEVYENPTISATGSVVVVLPPSPLPDTTTIPIDPYTTSLEYGHTTTTVNPQGGTVTTFVTTTTIVTVTPPAITTTAVQFSNVNLTFGPGGTTAQSFVPVPSLSIPPIALTLPDGEGGSTARNVTLPPWPAISNGPPEQWPDPTSPWGLNLNFTKPPSTTTTPTTTMPIPFWTTWPGGTIIPVSTSVEDPKPTDGGVNTPYVSGHRRSTSKVGTGFFHRGFTHRPPPDIIDFPPKGWEIKGTLPPWPKITFLRDHQQCSAQSRQIEYSARSGAGGFDGKYKKIEAESLGFTAFFWVPGLNRDTEQELRANSEVRYMYDYEHYNTQNPPPYLSNDASADPAYGDTSIISSNISNTNSAKRLGKRASASHTSGFFELSQVSIPNTEYWPLPQNEHVIPKYPDNPDDPTKLYKYWYDDSSGNDQYVYLAGELGNLWENHEEFDYTDWKFETVPPLAEYGADPGIPVLGAHINGVAAKVNGWNLGVALEATVVKLDISPPVVANSQSYTVQVYEKVLEQLLNAANHIKENNRQGKAVVNLSAGWKANERPATFFVRMSPIDEYPANFGYANIFSAPLPNMIIVGATAPDGKMWEKSQYDDWITTFAPGAAISVPHKPNDHGSGFYDVAQGPPLLRDPANVKKMIRLFHRKLDIWMPQVASNQVYKPSIWNGQVREKSCLADIDNIPWDGWELCPDINRDLSQQPDNGAPVSGGCDSGVATRDILQGRDDGLGCSISNVGGTPISYALGSASQTCITNCGELCDGYYCQTKPTGPPPDHYDPKDPNNPTATSDEPPQPTEACDDKCKLDRGYPCNCNEIMP
ncbi:hypothetical protein DL768_009601 [Monosporascus sp. mg162]|nr:hypothetical protein DL768_009601 [Monosporascus sp. mg162]